MFYSCRSKAPIEELGRRLDDHGRRACLAWDACLQFLSTDVQAGPEISILAENDLERTFPKGLGHQVWGGFFGAESRQFDGRPPHGICRPLGVGAFPTRRESYSYSTLLGGQQPQPTIGLGTGPL